MEMIAVSLVLTGALVAGAVWLARRLARRES